MLVPQLKHVFFVVGFLKSENQKNNVWEISEITFCAAVDKIQFTK